MGLLGISALYGQLRSEASCGHFSYTDGVYSIMCYVPGSYVSRRLVPSVDRFVLIPSLECYVRVYISALGPRRNSFVHLVPTLSSLLLSPRRSALKMPSPSSSDISHTAQVSLDFIVVGGSIAGTINMQQSLVNAMSDINFVGLATAYALREAGHNVLVIERTDGSSRVCSIIHLVQPTTIGARVAYTFGST